MPRLRAARKRVVDVGILADPDDVDGRSRDDFGLRARVAPLCELPREPSADAPAGRAAGTAVSTLGR
jgi:hypothetical protein